MDTTPINAKALIIEAAEKSGLLRGIAELLWFANQHSSQSRDRAARELRNELIMILQRHAVVPGLVGKQVYGEGADIAPTEEHEVEAFIG